MISINKLTKRFDDTVALNNVSIDIGKGIVCGLAGSNGSGKSTLLRIMSGVYDVTDGELFIDDSLVYDNPEINVITYQIIHSFMMIVH